MTLSDVVKARVPVPATARPVPPPPRTLSPPVRLQEPRREAPQTVRPAPPPVVREPLPLADTRSRPRAPAPIPSRPPIQVRKPPPPADSNARKFPRAELHVPVRLSLADDPTRFFGATLNTLNISVGGMFLESEFFLKMGTRLLVELTLPPKHRVVRVKGEVVRQVTGESGNSGFALRFVEYFDGSHVALATHFLSPMLKDFIEGFAREHRIKAGPEYVAQTIDVISAWELRKAELGADVWLMAGPG
jgi:hypothetical protein